MICRPSRSNQLQSGFSNASYPDGHRVLERVIARARERALLMLLDAKRGDVGSTADAYARAYLEPGSVIRADALTVNPYPGLDTLEPFASRARSFGRGLFVLVRTSNPGASDLQDLAVSSHSENAGKEPEHDESGLDYINHYVDAIAPFDVLQRLNWKTVFLQTVASGPLRQVQPK